MWTHENLREGYAEGAGNSSVPFVEYVMARPLKGSLIAGEASVFRVFENGCEERSRMAWVRVGWKRPPWEGEYAVRWVGRTWPYEKKVLRNLFRKQIS